LLLLLIGHLANSGWNVMLLPSKKQIEILCGALMDWNIGWLKDI